MTTTLAVSPTDSTIRMISKAVGYTGRKINMKAKETVTISGTAWDGGSRDTYFVLRLSNGDTLPVPRMNPSAFGGPAEDPVINLQDDVCVVRHSIFCGKDMGLTIFVHPNNMAPLLPPKADLTIEERSVLLATKSYKSSYNGQTRREMHNDWCRAPYVKLSQEAWDTAKATLITKGLLDKRGAITVEGRNVVTMPETAA